MAASRIAMVSWASKGSRTTGPFTLRVPLPGSAAESVSAAGPRTGHVRLSTPTSSLVTVSCAAGFVVSSKKAALAPPILVCSTVTFQGFAAGWDGAGLGAAAGRGGAALAAGAAVPPPLAMVTMSRSPVLPRRIRASSPASSTRLSVTSRPARSKRLSPTPRLVRDISVSLLPGRSRATLLTVTAPFAATVDSPAAVGAYSTARSVPSTAAKRTAGCTLSSVSASLAPSILIFSTRTLQGGGAASAGGGAVGVAGEEAAFGGAPAGGGGSVFV